MSTHPADFRVEIIKARPQGIVSPVLGAPVAGDVLDITDRVPREGFGSINRAMERDLLSFKTGDLTLTMRNHDGYFDDLFAFFGATDSWGLRVYRRGEVQFYGAVIGVGSLSFDRKAKTVELTAYGLTKLLDQTSANGVSRDIADMTVTTATAGTTTITLDSTTGLLSGDVLHVTDHTKSEDLTVKQVTSATVCSLEAAIVGSGGYASGSAVTLTTPFYRYKTIATLVEDLFTEAGIGLSDLRIDESQFSRPAPTPVNLSGLDFTYFAVSGPAEKNGRRMQLLGDSALTSWKSLYQTDPDDTWTQEDTTNQPWVDWSRYHVQGAAQPSTMFRGFSRPEIIWTSGGYISKNAPNPHAVGWDFAGLRMFCFAYVVTGERYVLQFSTADGVTWALDTQVLLATVAVPSDAESSATCCEFLGSRVAIVSHASGATKYFQIVDCVGATATSIKLAGDAAGDGYFGPCYIPEKDYVVALRSSSATGPAFTISAFQKTSATAAPRLWNRSFPSCLITNAGATGSQNVYPTQTMRYVNGVLYCLAVIDGGLHLVYSDDEFVTYKTAEVSSGTSTRGYYGARIGDQYAIAYTKDSAPRVHQICAPFYAGVIEYADFEDLSVAEGLKKLSVITNAMFWVDDDLQGHFVARDLYDASAVQDVGDRVAGESDSLLWDETAQFVTVSGNSVEATAGDDSFAAEGIDLQSSFIPNEAFAQALADDYYGFYSKARKYVETEIHDTDGKIYRPLDRVTLGGVERYLVYESDHGLTDDRVQVTLLEDV